MFDKKTKNRIIILNGATGTNLFSEGLKPGESPSVLNLRNPNAVMEIQKAYVNAGADIILTNTFSANPFNIQKKDLIKVLEAGIDIARIASRGKAGIWADIGPFGELIEPYGPLKVSEAQEIYRSIFKVFHKKGIQDFFIETFTSITEAKIAFFSALSFARNIAVSLSLQDNLHTLMGEIPESIAVTFDSIGAAAIGINCSTPEVVINGLARMKDYTDKPLIAKPNAGRVVIKGNKIYNSLNDRQLAGYYSDFIKAGARLIGGCCGTTPAFIKMISSKSARPVSRPKIKGDFVCSGRSVINLNTLNLIVVGERLNPSGRKKLRAAIQRHDYSLYGEEAKKQEKAGANILDVNAYVAELDEKKTVISAVNEVNRSSKLPIMLDCQNFEAAIAIMERYPGIGFLNSIPARGTELKKWLPLIRKYGFKVVISLIGRKIPRTLNERMANVREALKVAKNVGYRTCDLVFDPLVFAHATEPDQIPITLQAVRLLQKQKLASILGISNVSFGLPNRSLINSSFVANAISAGVKYIIINPLDPLTMGTVVASRALFNGQTHDYLKFTKSNAQLFDLVKKDPGIQRREILHDIKSESGLSKAIINGEKEKINVLTEQLLNSGIKPQNVIDKYNSQALHRVGEYYESGHMFIPDLLRSAEAAKAALVVIKKYLPRKQQKGKVVLATVRGDIHDIGKNIAGMVFESSGYKVIDLGKDVPTSRIIESVKKHKPDVLGLSALLTTTMPEMANIITQLKKNRLSVKVIIGGPNVSTEYAKKIGAYGAARNVLDGLRILKSMF